MIHPDHKLIVELHVEYEREDRRVKLVIAEVEDPSLWTELLGRILLKEKQGKR